MKLKLVKVEWWDITNENEWVSIKELDTRIEGDVGARYFSVGWLYQENEKYLVLLPSISLDDEGELEDVSYELIPMGAVIEITVLE